MELSPYIVFIVVLAVVFYQLFKRNVFKKRKQFILNFKFPDKVNQALQDNYPHLSTNQQRQVIKGLRDYFQVCMVLGKKPVAMPSKVVDLAWHEFILFTKAYKAFCRQAFGRFLHHTPAEAMASQITAQEGIKNCWREACNHKNINPNDPKNLPLLFAIDKKLKIEGGFHYTRDCKKNNGGDYCASHIGCGNCGSCSNDGCSSCDNGCSGCGD